RSSFRHVSKSVRIRGSPNSVFIDYLAPSKKYYCSPLNELVPGAESTPWRQIFATVAFDSTTLRRRVQRRSGVADSNLADGLRQVFDAFASTDYRPLRSPRIPALRQIPASRALCTHHAPKSG